MNSLIENVCPRCAKSISDGDLQLGTHDCGLTFDAKDFEHLDVICTGSCGKKIEIRTIPEIFVPLYQDFYYCDDCQNNLTEFLEKENPLGLEDMDEAEAEVALAHSYEG